MSRKRMIAAGGVIALTTAFAGIALALSSIVHYRHDRQFRLWRWRRRSEIRPVRRSESDPPEGRSFYALCSFGVLLSPWPGSWIGRSSGRADCPATDARYPGPRRLRIR